MKRVIALAILPLLIQGKISADAEDLHPLAIEKLQKMQEFYLGILPQSETLGLREDAAHVSQQLAAISLEFGDFTKGLQYIEEALENYRALDPFETITRLHIIDSRILKARLLGFLKHYTKATEELLAVFQENLEIRGEEDPETMKLYNHIGWHLDRLVKEGGHLQDLSHSHAAFMVLEWALGESGTLESEDRRDTILLLAQKCYEKTLLANLMTVGEHHPDTAKSYSLIGWVLGSRGQYMDALNYHQAALAIRLDSFSETHRDTARTYGHIAWNCEQLKEYEEALRLYKVSLNIREQVLPQDHPERQECEKNIQRVEKILYEN